MQQQTDKRATARITAQVRRANERQAKRRATRLPAILASVGAMFSGIFSRRSFALVHCSRNWHYDGPVKARDCNGGRYDRAMRKRGRKYKLACA